VLASVHYEVSAVNSADVPEMKKDVGEAAVKPIHSQARIPLVFACDESYAMPLAAALRSIAEAKRTVDSLEVYILYNTFQSQTRTRVMNSLPPGAVSIRWVPVDLTRFEACSTTSYISGITYARLLIPELLPRSITKVLYVDADILVFDDLIALQEIDLNGAAIGAVLDRLDSRLKAGDTLWTKDLPCVRDYFNAGVLLIDLERWRQDRISERAFEYLSQHPHSPLSDQDALNVVCDRAWKQLEPRWNFLNDFETDMSGVAVGDGPAILHFAGQLKPWQIGILDPNARLYDLIRSRTCFARTNRDKVKDSLKAPVRFYQSGLWWQLKRLLRRYKALRRIWHHIMHARQIKAQSL
jgi:lipopolysaccharide biosynthesis glycosyltransferase